MATKSKGKPELRISFSGQSNGPIVVSWLEADAVLVLRLIDVCNDCNCTPSFGVTRDGGAWRAYFLHDQIPKDERNQYCRGTEDVNEWLVQLIDFWEGQRDSEKGP